MNSPAKKKLIAQVKMAQKALGLDDGTYHAMMLALTGHESSTQCTEG